MLKSPSSQGLHKREQRMLIGELARRTGASPKAIRLYEARGLLPLVRRSGAYRIYTEAHFRQVQIIRQAQTLGFTLAELSSALYTGQNEPDWEKLLQQLDRKRAAIRQDIGALKRLEARLEQVEADIRVCLAGRPGFDRAVCDGAAISTAKGSSDKRP